MAATVLEHNHPCPDIDSLYAGKIDAEDSSTRQSRPVTTNYQPPQHVLLHPKLAGATVKAFIAQEASKSKEASITIDDTNGYCYLRTKKYHVWEPISPEKATPKHPNPAYDNGLVIILQGEHVGKYGRRLDHVRRNGVVYMILGVVEVTEGQSDRLTGEVIEMNAKELCLVDESKEQKRHNTDLMKVPRQKYQEQNR